MKEYFLTTFETEHGNFFEDYLSNQEKRFQTFLNNSNFWREYIKAYENAKLTGDLILRAKVIDGKKFTLYQIWRDETARRNFDNNVDEDYFMYNFKFPYTRQNYIISEKEKISLIEEIMSSNSILQWVSIDHRVPGMCIGDPLKNDTILKV